MRFLRIAIVFFMLLFLGGFFYISSEVDPQLYLIEILERWESNYIWIILIVFGITLVSTLGGLPVFYLSVALGFFISYFPALALAWIINLFAIITTYFMVQKVYSNYFREKYEKKNLIKRINKRIKKYGLWTVAISRSVYIIPTNIINLSFPLSKISFKQYAFGTMMGLVPESLINVTTGYLLRHELLLLNSPEGNLLKISIITFSLIIMIGGFLIFRNRRRKSRKDKINDIISLLGEE